MLVKNKKSGEVEAMRHGPAVDAVTAGTHEFVNLKEGTADGQQTGGEQAVDLDKMTKDELVAEAEKRGVEVKASDTKADIIKALEAK